MDVTISAALDAARATILPVPVPVPVAVFVKASMTAMACAHTIVAEPS